MVQKLNAKAIANALGILAAVSYIICAAIIWINKDFAVRVGSYLVHGIDLTNIAVRGLGDSIIGLILGTAIAWVTGYVFAVIYNKLS